MAGIDITQPLSELPTPKPDITKPLSERAKPRPAPRISIDITKPLSELPRFLTVREVAAYVRRSTRTISTWEQRGLIRVLRPAGGYPIIENAEVARILAEAL